MTVPFENGLIYELLDEKEAANLNYSILENKELIEWISNFWNERLKDERSSYHNLSIIVGQHEMMLSDMTKQLKNIESKIRIKD